MKILHVISSLNPEGGGPVEGLRQLASENKKNGHEIEVASLDSPEAPFLADFPIPVYACGPAKLSYKYSSHLLPWLRVNVEKYDVVIVNGIWQYHSLCVWRAMQKSTIPYYVFTHGMLDPWFKRAYPLKHLKKWLYWPWADYRVLRDAKAVIFTCEEEKLLARRSFWLYRANEIVTSYGTCNPPKDEVELRRRFLAAHPGLKGKRIVLFLSRIHEKKGCDMLIEAFSKVALKDERLHLIMAGPDQTGWVAKLKARAIELGIQDKISWVGMLNGDDKWGAYYTSEVFCLPSHQENFGIVVAEALACGKPVLVSNKVNIWREIESTSAGFVAEDSVIGTLNNLERWLKLDIESYLEIVANARRCFREHFHMERSAERLIEIVKGGLP